AACLGCIGLILALLLSGVFSARDQFVFTQAINMRDDFRCGQRDQANDSEPKPEMGPRSGTFDGVPSRQPGHGFLPWLLAMAAAFSYLPRAAIAIATKMPAAPIQVAAFAHQSVSICRLAASRSSSTSPRSMPEHGPRAGTTEPPPGAA